MSPLPANGPNSVPAGPLQSVKYTNNICLPGSCEDKIKQLSGRFLQQMFLSKIIIKGIHHTSPVSDPLHSSYLGFAFLSLPYWPLTTTRCQDSPFPFSAQHKSQFFKATSSWDPQATLAHGTFLIPAPIKPEWTYFFFQIISYVFILFSRPFQTQVLNRPYSQSLELLSETIPYTAFAVFHPSV